MELGVIKRKSFKVGGKVDKLTKNTVLQIK